MIDYDLTRIVRLVKNTRNPTSGWPTNWALQEVDERGEPFDVDQTPWRHSTRLVTNNLRISLEMTGDRKRSVEDWGSLYEEKEFEELITEFDELIQGTFSPVDCNISFFGTDRSVDELEFQLRPIDHSKKESISCQGSVGFRVENDFKYHLVPDHIQLYMFVHDEKYFKIKELIFAKLPIEVNLFIKGVSGFYANSSHRISTEKIKILPDLETFGIEKPANSELKIPVLGKIAEFSITIKQL